MSARFRRCFATLVLIFSGIIAAPAAFAETTYTFNLPEQSLADSLRAIGQQTEMNILFEPDAVKNTRSPALRGQYTVDEAIRLVLMGTKLEAQHTAASNVVIKTKSARSTAMPPTSVDAPDGSGTRLARSNSGGPQSQTAGPQNTDTSNSTSEPSKKEDLSEIIVTGTLIHNIEPITPAITITGQQMIEQGYSRLDQVFDQLPQNFNSVAQTSNGFIGIGSNSGANQFFASGVDLRGLGAGATLVLLNGRRLAMTAEGSAVDISSIPVSVIDRVEILTDGASAIYGSDAVAGVVNIITKRDYSGVETGVRSTEITQGKAPDYGGHVLAGYNWSSGNVMVNFDGEKDNALSSTARPFEPASSAPVDLLPEQIRRSVFLSARQELSSQLSLSSDVLVSDRTFVQGSDAALAHYGPVSGFAQQVALSLEIDYAFTPEWNLKVSGQFSREKDFNQQFPPAAAPTSTGDVEYLTYKTSTVDAVVDGKLFELPGGSVRAAAGGQAKRESLFDEALSVNASGAYGSSSSNSYADRTSEAVFGELFIPIVGASNAIPLVRRLNLDVAGRFDHYTDFGSTTNPKVSLQWVPTEGLTAHASYSKSFRAPELYELGAGIPKAGYIYASEPNPASPTGVTSTLLLDGANPNLQPEHANTYNAGLTFKPVFLSGLKVDLDFFHIDYKDRVDRLINENYFLTALVDANQLGSLVNLNPTQSQINALLNDPSRLIYNDTNGFCQVGKPGCVTDPTLIGAIANIGYVNIGVATVQGYDLDARYDWDTGVGRFVVDVASTLMTENSIQITPSTAAASMLNNAGDPLRLRAKANLGWSTASWSVYGRANYANAYHNALDPNCPVFPGCRVSSWTTVDSGIAYTTPKDAGIGGGVRISFDVMNVFNRVPPYVNVPGVFPRAYDSSNANPLLRVLSVSLTKKW